MPKAQDVPSSSLERWIKNSPNTLRGSFGLWKHTMSAYPSTSCPRGAMRRSKFARKSLPLLSQLLHTLHQHAGHLAVEVLADWGPVGGRLARHGEARIGVLRCSARARVAVRIAHWGASSRRHGRGVGWGGGDVGGSRRLDGRYIC